MSASSSEQPYLTHTRSEANLHKLWEEFNAGITDLNEPEAYDPYDRMLLEEWRRCKKLGINTMMQYAPVLGTEEFTQVLASRRFLMEKAIPVLTRVQELFVGVPGILILADAKGTLLHIIGDPQVRLKAADISNLTEGADWNESAAGTNGIGTAISKKKPVHVFSAEHFCEGWHTWTCAGAPILDPYSGDIAGVIDFTTRHQDYSENAIALSYSIATNITTELRLQMRLEQIQLAHQHSLYSSRFPSDDVIVYNRMGRLVATSVRAEDRISSCGSPPPGEERSHTEEIHDICLPGTEDTIGQIVVRRRESRARAFVATTASSPEIAAYGAFLTADANTKQVMERIAKVARSDLNVLLIGETGTGKELVARHIHNESKRKSGSYVAVNCGAISKELFQSTLFGYSRGAFTGADSRGRKGLFECANGGTLFLDEVGELPLDIQAGLLRVLETHNFRPVGSDREQSTDCRIVAATNQPLSELVANGSFRSDLYYRLSVVKFDIPPLRERPQDVPILIDSMLKAFCAKHDLPIKGITPDATRVLTAHSWPGNGREVRNTVEAACVSADGFIDVEDLPADIIGCQVPLDAAAGREVVVPRELGQASREDFSLREQEARLILGALKKYKKVSLVAEVLGLSRSTLYRKFEAFGIDPRAVVRNSRQTLLGRPGSTAGFEM